MPLISRGEASECYAGVGERTAALTRLAEVASLFQPGMVEIYQEYSGTLQKLSYFFKHSTKSQDTKNIGVTRICVES